MYTRAPEANAGVFIIKRGGPAGYVADAVNTRTLATMRYTISAFQVFHSPLLRANVSFL